MFVPFDAGGPAVKPILHWISSVGTGLVVSVLQDRRRASFAGGKSRALPAASLPG